MSSQSCSEEVSETQKSDQSVQNTTYIVTANTKVEDVVKNIKNIKLVEHILISNQTSESEDEDQTVESPIVLNDTDDENSEEINAFKLVKKDVELNPDGSKKFEIKSKLMLKLEELDPNAECSDDALDNSFEELQGSQCESEDEDEDDEDDEMESAMRKEEDDQAEVMDEEEEYDEECESPELLKKKKKGLKSKKKTLFEKVMEPESPEKNKKPRKNIMNVCCTEYEIIKRVAKRIVGYRCKEYEEDHEGGIINGEGNQKLSADWDVTWHDLGVTPDFLSKMQPYQKVNQYPGMYQVTRKNYLARNLNKMSRAFPNDYKFFPKTWLIPQEASDFRNQFLDSKGQPLKHKKTYIVKPENLSQGQGIYLSRNCEKIIENCSAEGGFIVQDYIDKPHLIDDLKYDLRIYVLLYGINPMRVYVHEQGIARFATEPYVAPKPSNLDNMFMHLTNYAINKANTAFQQNQGGAKGRVPQDDEESEECETDEEEESGHKRSLNAILKILYDQGADPDKIFDEIKDIIVKTLIVGQPYMSHIYRSCQPEDQDNSMCYQILGFDIMIDRHFKPWLIEVNQSPSFGTDSALDYEIKKAVLRDTFKLLNVSQDRRNKFIKLRQKQMAERILTGKQDKVDPLEKKRIKEERLKERFAHENAQMRCGSGNNFELIFPSLYEEEKNEQYEQYIKKANQIWDEFTTGTKGKRKAAELAEQERKHEIERKKKDQVRKEMIKHISSTTADTAKPSMKPLTKTGSGQQSRQFYSQYEDREVRVEDSITHREIEERKQDHRSNQSRTPNRPVVTHKKIVSEQIHCKTNQTSKVLISRNPIDFQPGEDSKETTSNLHANISGKDSSISPLRQSYSGFHMTTHQRQQANENLYPGNSNYSVKITSNKHRGLVGGADKQFQDQAAFQQWTINNTSDGFYKANQIQNRAAQDSKDPKFLVSKSQPFQPGLQEQYQYLNSTHQKQLIKINSESRGQLIIPGTSNLSNKSPNLGQAQQSNGFKPKMQQKSQQQVYQRNSIKQDQNQMFDNRYMNGHNIKYPANQQNRSAKNNKQEEPSNNFQAQFQQYRGQIAQENLQHMQKMSMNKNYIENFKGGIPTLDQQIQTLQKINQTLQQNQAQINQLPFQLKRYPQIQQQVGQIQEQQKQIIMNQQLQNAINNSSGSYRNLDAQQQLQGVQPQHNKADSVIYADNFFNRQKSYNKFESIQQEGVVRKMFPNVQTNNAPAQINGIAQQMIPKIHTVNNHYQRPQDNISAQQNSKSSQRQTQYIAQQLSNQNSQGGGRLGVVHRSNVPQNLQQQSNMFQDLENQSSETMKRIDGNAYNVKFNTPKLNKQINQQNQAMNLISAYKKEDNLFYQNVTPVPADKQNFDHQQQPVSTPLLRQFQKNTRQSHQNSQGGAEQPQQLKGLQKNPQVLQNSQKSTYFVPTGNNFNPNRRTCK